MLQILANSLLAASIYALVGLGFGLAYQVTGFLNFAHGILITTAAYGLYLFRGVLGLPWPISLALALMCSITVSLLLYACVFGPLRRFASTPLTMLLASLGTYVVVQNVLSLVFGDRIQTVQTGPVLEGVGLFGVRLTLVQMLTALSAIVCVALLHLMLQQSRIGRMIRAFADNPEYAAIVGIPGRRVLLVVLAVSGGLAGVAGVALAVDTGVTPGMGMHPFMIGVVAAVLGGNRSAWGVALGAVLLSLAQNYGGWMFGSQWQDAVAFSILLLFLLLRPQGFLGRAAHKVTV